MSSVSEPTRMVKFKDIPQLPVLKIFKKLSEDDLSSFSRTCRNINNLFWLFKRKSKGLIPIQSRFIENPDKASLFLLSQEIKEAKNFLNQLNSWDLEKAKQELDQAIKGENICILNSDTTNDYQKAIKAIEIARKNPNDKNISEAKNLIYNIYLKHEKFSAQLNLISIFFKKS